MRAAHRLRPRRAPRAAGGRRCSPTDLAAHPAGSSFETTCTRRDGDELPVEVHVGRIEAATPLLVVTLRDRTELEAGRTARFEAEAKYRALVEHIPAVVYLDPVDEDSESIYVSPQVVELLGHQPGRVADRPYAWRHHVHPEDIERAWDEYRHAYNAHEPLNHEYRMVHEDGTSAGSSSRRTRSTTRPASPG